jgi:hypothetical protein
MSHFDLIESTNECAVCSLLFTKYSSICTHLNWTVHHIINKIPVRQTQHWSTVTSVYLGDVYFTKIKKKSFYSFHQNRLFVNKNVKMLTVKVSKRNPE